MQRQQVLVQLDDELLAALDERAASEGVSRSELLRRLARRGLGSDLEARVDDAITEGYRRVPAQPGDELVRALAIASIEAEPW